MSYFITDEVKKAAMDDANWSIEDELKMPIAVEAEKSLLESVKESIGPLTGPHGACAKIAAHEAEN